ncbi:hypothetical protein AVDCRST_MAG94-5223, partial [uncultured Leptolyngbya sp.]
ARKKIASEKSAFTMFAFFMALIPAIVNELV